MTPSLAIHPDSAALAFAAADAFAVAAAKAIAGRGTFTVAVSGGSTPKAMFQLLATPNFSLRIDWPSVEVYFVDERGVPPEHDDSNFKMANNALLSRVPIKPENIHRMRGEIDANQSAIEYGRLLKARFRDDGVDQCWLGMGDDGHTASLFPHSPAVKETHHRCVAQFLEHSTTGRSWRITMTAPFINRSTEVVVLLAGEKKAVPLAEVLNGPRDPERLPMQLIQPASGRMTWMLDRAATAKLSNL
jgi:6-phosphogluconolactonase